MELSGSSQLKQYITFEVEDEIYALDVMSVESIERMTQITRVPHSPYEVLGVINLRGDVIPVMSARRMLGFEEKPATDASRIAIIRHYEYRIGMIVDRIHEILNIPQDRVQWGVDTIGGKKKVVISGLVNLGDKPVMIVDIPSTLELLLE